MRRILFGLVATLAIFGSTGCGTLVTTAIDPKPYGGVQLDAQTGLFVDLPASLVADTLVLPYTVFPHDRSHILDHYRY